MEKPKKGIRMQKTSDDKRKLTPIQFADQYLQPYRINGTEIVPQLCPVCHGGNSQDAFTFALNIYTGAWNCKRGSCNAEGNFHSLTEMFGEEGVIEGAQSISMKSKKEYALPSVEIGPLTDEIIEYFKTRKISRETLEAFKVGSGQDGVIAFPIMRNGVLVSVKYRPPRKVLKGERKEWKEKGTEPILFNMDNVAFNSPLYITEGLVDAMSLYEAGVPNVVSVHSGCENLEWINLCWEWLEKFERIVIFGDADEPGQAMVKKVVKALGEERCSVITDYPSRPGSPDVPCKDPNEILYFYGPEELKKVALSAEEVEIKGIIQLSDVRRVDYTTVPRVLSRIPKFDEVIGGFFDGTLTVVTGKRGEGKLLADSTPVYTSNGWSTHGDLREGDYVMNPSFEWVQVQHIFPKGLADMYIKFSTGETIYCHANHEWPVSSECSCDSGSLEDSMDRFLRICYPDVERKSPRPNRRSPSVRIMETKSIYSSLETASFINGDKRIRIEEIGFCSAKIGNCIQVEGGLYLCGETFIPTHNSTVNGTILLNAVEQGRKVFAYSGELAAPKFQDWILLQAAGSDYITLKEDKFRGRSMPFVPEDVASEILKWTRDKFYIVDNSEFRAGFDEEENIIRLCEKAARRYGCHMFLIDNAMTVIGASSEERMNQIKLVTELKRLAVRYDAAVILVAHPRKLPPGMRQMGDDDISGASEIINLADAAFSVEKPDIRLLKNRDEGVNVLIECAYAPDSRRVYQLDKGDTYQYSWDKSKVKPPRPLAKENSDYAVRVSMKSPI